MSSKRGADEYLTKDNQYNINFGSEAKNKMATAAQMAKRKIAQPRPPSRSNRGSTPTGSSFLGVNGAQQPQQQTFGTIGAVTFGGENNPFTSSFNGSSPNFDFSAPTALSLPPFNQPMNPFANTNGNSNSTATQNGDAMMESPQKRQNTGISFSENNGTNSTSNFTFGQSQETGKSVFGGSQPNHSFEGSTSIFDRISQPDEPRPFANMFSDIGKPKEPAQAVASVFNFGSPMSTQQQPANPFGRLQSQTTTEPQSKPFSFGETSSSQPSLSSFPFGQNQSFGGFGASKADEQNQSTLSGETASLSQPSTNMFGFAPSPSTTPNIFGKNTQQSQTTPQVSLHPFTEQPKPAPPRTNLFADMFAPKPTTCTSGATTGSVPASNLEMKAQDVGHSLFGSMDPPVNNSSFETSKDESVPSNGKPSAPEAASAAATIPASGIPSLSQPSQESEAEETPRPKIPQFGGSATAIFQPTPTSSGNGFFSNVKPAESEGSKTSSLFTNLSKPIQPLQTTPAATSKPDKPSINPFDFKAGPAKSLHDSAPTEEASRPKSGSLFNFDDVTSSGSREAQATKPTVTNDAKNIFAPSASNSKFAQTSSQSAQSSHAPQPAATPEHFQAASSTHTVGQANPPDKSKTRSRTIGPPYIPAYFDNNERAEHDKTYRLRALDREFKKHVEGLNFHKHDFGNLVRCYIEARESIGRPVGGLYSRSMAGTKRKNDDDDRARDESDSSQAKRSKVDSLDSIDQGTAGNASSAFVQGDKGSKPGNKDAPAADTNSSSDTSSMFKKMASTPPVSSSDSTAASASSAKGLFGNLQSGMATSTTKPSFSSTVAQHADTTNSLSSNPFATLGKPNSLSSAPALGMSSMFKPTTKSTTPPNSPPKKPDLEMPKFDSGRITNLMSSFAQEAEKGVAKEKAKRKAEDFDSDEETEQDFETRMKEEDRRKKARLAEIRQTGFKPSVEGTVSGTSQKPVFSFGGTPAKFDAQNPFAKSASTAATMTPSTPFSFTGFGQQSSHPGVSFGSALESAPERTTAQSIEISDNESPNSPNGTNTSREEDLEDAVDDESSLEDDSTDDQNAEDSEAEDGAEASGQPGEDDDDGESGDDLQLYMQASRENKGKSLFERTELPKPKDNSQSPRNASGSASLSNEPPILQNAPNSSFKPHLAGSEILQSTPKAPRPSPFTPTSGVEASKQVPRPTSTFIFNEPPPTTTPTPVLGASVLHGGPVKEGPIIGEGLFGSRSSTPVPSASNPATKVSAGGNVFAGMPTTPEPQGSVTSGVFASFLNGNHTSSPKGDFTYKRETPIKFGESPAKTNAAPTLSITAATPHAKDDALASKNFPKLFGFNAVSASQPVPGNASSAGVFPGTQASTASAALTPLPAVPSHLLPPAVSSTTSSRANSPGLTDNESVATEDAEDFSSLAQSSLMSARPGEEGEEVLWEGRSKAMKYFDGQQASISPGMKPNEYNTMGVGELRILKNNDKNKTRILFRAEPSSKIIINSNLVPGVTYASDEGGKSGTVRFGIMTKDGFEKWVLRTKTKAIADELAKILEESKDPA